MTALIYPLGVTLGVLLVILYPGVSGYTYLYPKMDARLGFTSIQYVASYVWFNTKNPYA